MHATQSPVPFYDDSRANLASSCFASSSFVSLPVVPPGEDDAGIVQDGAAMPPAPVVLAESLLLKLAADAPVELTDDAASDIAG